MTPKTYVILRRAIEEGAAHAARIILEGADVFQATPHDNTRASWAATAIEREVMSAIDEVFSFPDVV